MRKWGKQRQEPRMIPWEESSGPANIRHLVGNPTHYLGSESRYTIPGVQSFSVECRIDHADRNMYRLVVDINALNAAFAELIAALYPKTAFTYGASVEIYTEVTIARERGGSGRTLSQFMPRGGGW